MLSSITASCIDLIHVSDETLSQALQDQARIHRWPDEVRRDAVTLLDDPVHKVQLAMDILSSWGDQEIYDFVGIQSL